MEKANLSCLDHEYFRGEVNNLEKRLNKIVINLSKNKRDFDLEFVFIAIITSFICFFRNKWKLIDDIKKQLKTKKNIIDNLERFNPECFLNEIYDVDSVFRKIEVDKWNEINMEEFIEACQPKKFCDENNLVYDDYYYEEENFDEDYEEQLFYGRKYTTQFGKISL